MLSLPFSVLMTTYAGERAEYLRQSLDSLANQTCRAAQYVLVIDGAIDSAQESVIAEYSTLLPLSVIRIPSNQGLAGALTIGLASCNQPWCARMDSDDICEPTRFEEQWAAIQADPTLDLIATWTAEFESDPRHILSYKTGPEQHQKIVRTLYWRNVVHHPTVVMRIGKIHQAGGYTTEFPLLEDYDLFLRMAAVGARMTILPKSLLRFRVSAAQRRRRGGLRYLVVEARFRYRCITRRLTPTWIAISAMLLLIPFRLMPGFAKSWAYRWVRKKATPSGTRR